MLTTRLELIPATVELARADLSSHADLARHLGVRVPPTWPPEFYDPPAIEFAIARLEEGPDQAGWWLWYFVRRADTGAEPILIGAGGYKGTPSRDGSVEIGYSILPEHQRRGYATEAARGLLAHAFSIPEVKSVTAETLPALEGSIAVLKKCGFRLLGEGSEPGVIRFEVIRP